MSLIIRNLEAGIDGKKILHGIDLDVEKGEIHALMGPNGSGKSTLANVLAGHPAYEVYGGSVELDGADLLALGPDERSLAGLYLAFQYPAAIPGVTVGRYLKRLSEIRAGEDEKLKVGNLLRDIRTAMDFLEMDQDFINRYLNDGFSGGEKKRMEVLQMLLLKPTFAILDETDSGLDIDALRIVARGVNKLRGRNFTGLVITHYQRILDHIKPDRVHIMYEGKMVTSGGPEIVNQLEKQGYDWVRELRGEVLV
ncbi:MAG: Fe-S cluster assembly ATPase SufC [Spirochaetales bacterium]|nr:Fe-S cluster assembly ATPase SufC [Spirochaetales bacterium]